MPIGSKTLSTTLLLLALLGSAPLAHADNDTTSSLECRAGYQKLFSSVSKIINKELLGRFKKSPALSGVVGAEKEKLAKELSSVAEAGSVERLDAIDVLTHLSDSPATAEKEILATTDLKPAEKTHLEEGLEDARVKIDEIRSDPEISPILAEANEASPDAEAEMVGLYAEAEAKFDLEGVPKSRIKRILKAACPKQ
jgi:hypothetical protein